MTQISAPTLKRLIKRYAATIGCLAAMIWPVYLLVLQAINQAPVLGEIKWEEVKVIQASQAEPNFILERSSNEVLDANFLSDLSARAGLQYFIGREKLKEMAGCHARVGLRAVRTIFGVKYQVLQFACRDVHISYDQVLNLYENREERNLRGIKILAIFGVLLFCLFVDLRRKNG